MSGDDKLGRTIRQLVRERREQTEREHVAPEDLAAYYDGLSPQRAEEVEAHLAWCSGCVQVLKALEELDGGLGNLPQAAVSDERVAERVRCVQVNGYAGVRVAEPAIKLLGRAIVRGAGAVLDLQGLPEPSLRERVRAIRQSIPAFALLRDRLAVAGDLKGATRRVLDEEATRHGLCARSEPEAGPCGV